MSDFHLDADTERDIAERAKKWRGGLRQKMSADDQREAIEADRRATVVKIEALRLGEFRNHPLQKRWRAEAHNDALDAVLAILGGKP